MASASDNPSDPPQKMLEEPEANPMFKATPSVIDTIEKRVAAIRCDYIKKRVEENRLKLTDVSNCLFKLSMERRISKVSDSEKSIDLLTKRQKDAIDMQKGIDLTNGDKDSNNSQEDGQASSAILLGSSIAVKNAVRPIKLTEVKRLPPFTTWIFLDRNQRMQEDQSVVGRRRIYYDQNGGEALICSDSEEEIIEEEEEKKQFTEYEEGILRVAVREVGLTETSLDELAKMLSRKPSEVKERYTILIKGESAVEGSENPLLDKDLDAALDSFDNLFCRRCLVYDCRLHGCSQDLVFPAEKQLPWNCPADENIQCGLQCYKLALKAENNNNAKAISPVCTDDQKKLTPSPEPVPPTSKRKSIVPLPRRRSKSSQSETASSNCRNMSESSDSEIKQGQNLGSSPNSSSKPVGKGGVQKRNSKRVAERVSSISSQKKRKKSESEAIINVSCGMRDMKLRSKSCKENGEASSSVHKQKPPSGGRRGRKKKESVNAEDKKAVQPNDDELGDQLMNDNEKLAREEFVGENIFRHEKVDIRSWKPFEISLFEKGMEIFGKNSCLIARNLMNGLKTCREVFLYMNCFVNNLSSRLGDGSLLDGCSRGDGIETTGNGVRRRSRFLRRRGRVRRLKYTWKSTGYHSIRKRISERKDQPCRQFNPCGCKSACGKQCPCLLNGTCCEKYCGCPKMCKNRFRGCHCAKSQCRSRQCPCFAADRECDPDVCRNCWVSCGDGTLGVPSQRGDNYECRNMKLLLKQQQRVLLGPSDISGWGAFLKNSVGKHEYLGEYTGELISHREADKRGKIYDRENSSFLFNLNDQFVLDAYRKGDKLKFANHSPDPNCYAKVIMVAGDHRVGIFAKERISAGEELFYDYRYEVDRAPAWARKPDAPGAKKEDGAPSSGRAKKLA
ncbi:histone-lysine N-methyltransferase CLF isoform X2 [Impatiens glandulifera]|uniref:histone-lysine N-methyltransferase CLF isoform X2 n=1 Tax=Impatiens glandulifera TaxID=253017 RepID=UPI001FB055C3|nr:histone-lysine N-methyltransferase CLF isoform X2 [Impatiens glandulifera]